MPIEGWDAFMQATQELAGASGGGAGMIQAEDGSMVPPSFYSGGQSATPTLGENPFMGEEHGFAWNAEGQAVDPTDEAYMIAYVSENRDGSGAVASDTALR